MVWDERENAVSALEHTIGRPSVCVSVLLQEDVGHRELCVVHVVEEHAGERSEEGHQLPHEEEPVAARSQAEGPVSRSVTDKLPGGAE